LLWRARLRAELNWHDLFEGLIAGFAEAALAARQQEASRQAGVPPAG